MPPYVQSLVGPGLFTFLALLVWGIRQGWFARKVVRADRRAERKEDATDEYEMAVQSDKVYNLQTEREKKMSDVWKAQVLELEERHTVQIEELEKRRAADYAEYTHRLLGYQKDLSDAKARIVLLETENVKCTQTTNAQAVRIGGLEDRLGIVLQAIKSNGMDLGLDWMHPKPLPQLPPQLPPSPPATTVTTMIVQSESPPPPVDQK